ncbi:sterol desaturase family protein [Maribacter sp. ANRC-HE7]|uniref:Sterol desaturase family protein n=1 Tax=Maribacter aquimaris TaxID=2737171 RepID=A0ABR7V0F5_9FLAO|nr:sterol desaturase family protein [Maribacter aquimaris]MBD0776751.1 sterol desaturase family protein [Maribacter aquimaris]
MDAIIDFFTHLTSLQKLIWIIGLLTVFWLFEGAYPLRRFHYKKWAHATPNLILLSSTILINVLFGLATLGIFNWLEENEFGLLNLVEFPVWVELVLAIMLLDFLAQYVVHFMLHKVRFMWRFHMVHHSDTNIDVTSGTRHHPIDFVMRETFALLAIVIAGLPLAYYVIYRVLTILFTYFSHANISLPIWLDKIISLVFISPNTHKFHHHHKVPWTDTNYGNIFSLWDRAFGTFVYHNPKDIVYGLDILDNDKSNDILYQLKVPFVYKKNNMEI